MGAGGMSKSAVSRLCAEIDGRVNAFLARPLEGSIRMNSVPRTEFPTVRWALGAVDGPATGPTPPTSRSARAAFAIGLGPVAPRWLTVSRAVIVAVAVNAGGKREVLGIATGPSEAETFWTGFLRSLADRGLRGVKPVIADDHKGLRAAARRVFDATHQRCRVHWLRNALAHAPAKQRTAVAAMLKTIFAQESKAEAVAQWDVVADAARARSSPSSAP
jgi:transposase-like protein